MTDAVNAWKQIGRVFVWRYPPHKKKCAGWHFTAEDDACDALVQLVEAMRQSRRDSLRTITLTKPAPPIWGVPNFGQPIGEALGPLRLSYQPSFPDLMLLEDDQRLLLRLGEQRVGDLLAALNDVRRGKGDYAIGPTKDGAAPSIWFWWMPWSGSR